MSSLIPFHWTNTTNIAYGVNAIEKFKQYIPSGARVAIVNDGVTPQLCGAKQDLEKLLKELNTSFRWLGGIEANPDFESCMKIIKNIRQDPVDFLIAVGGGSVMDATKFISTAINLDPSIDPYTTMRNPTLVKSIIPMLSICTLSATGSEWNNGFVISRRATHEKLPMSNPLTYFKCSVLDPRYTLTVPANQTANGLYDSFCHVMEQYITNTFSPFPDRLSESVTKCILQNGPALMKDLKNLDLRGSMMINSAWALNRTLGLGTKQCWGTHHLGHELTAYYGMDHGKTLAVIMPNLWRHFFDVKKFKLAQMARRIFGKGGSFIDEDANYAIQKTEEWTQEIGMKLKISDYVKEPNVKKAVKELTDGVWNLENGKSFGEDGMITKKDAEAIYAASF